MTTPSLLATAGGTVLGLVLGTLLRGAAASPAPAPAPDVSTQAPASIAVSAPSRAESPDADAASADEAGILPHHRLASVQRDTAEGRFLLQFGQPFVVALTRDSWTDALVVTTLAVEVERELIDQQGAEAILRDQITTSLVRASRAGLFDGAVPRLAVTRSVRQVVAEALGETLPRGVDGVVVTNMAKKPVRG